MTRNIETSGKTTEEAIEIALKELDVDRADVEIDVVSQGKSGILGLGGEPAKVNVTVLEDPTDVVKTASQILDSLLSKMDVSAVVTLVSAYDEDIGGPVFDIDGDDSGLLIGRRGETLRAFQFLVSFMVGRQLGEKVRISIDVAGYQERRSNVLINMAERVAKKVAVTGRSVTMDPMPPNERRVVHMALANNPAVITNSNGVGDERKVVVEPSLE